ncbi:MAG: hypothetical protein RMY34_35915 [Aulosira sp. DedQUE10]|nr:hypothetical protein [Aulosira sp. DedQUE10]
MTETMSNFLTCLASGEMTIATIIVWILIVTILSMIGGALGGMLLAGKDIGYKFSAILGGLFGPSGVIPAILLGLGVLKSFAN